MMPELTAIFEQILELCEVDEDEFVVIAHQSQSRSGYREALLTAINAAGATGLSVELPGLDHSIFPYGGGSVVDVDSAIEAEPRILDAFRNADLVLDITAQGLVHSRARSIILDNGARMLTINEPPSVLERLVPTEALRERVETATGLLADADQMHISSTAGTDITVAIGDSPPLVDQYGYTTESGRWDGFPAGFAACYPIDDSPSGSIVLDVSDALLPMNRYVEEPVEIEIEGGRITSLERDSYASNLLIDYLEMWDEPGAYETSHFGFGLNQDALWEALEFGEGEGLMGQDIRGYAGNFMWSTGPNRFVGRDVRAHIDFVMRNCTIELDDTRIVDTGELVHPDLVP